MAIIAVCIFIALVCLPRAVRWFFCLGDDSPIELHFAGTLHKSQQDIWLFRRRTKPRAEAVVQTYPHVYVYFCARCLTRLNSGPSGGAATSWECRKCRINYGDPPRNFLEYYGSQHLDEKDSIISESDLQYYIGEEKLFEIRLSQLGEH